MPSTTVAAACTTERAELAEIQSLHIVGSRSCHGTVARSGAGGRFLAATSSAMIGITTAIILEPVGSLPAPLFLTRCL